MDIPVNRTFLRNLSKQVEHNTPMIENPIGDGFLLDPQMSIAISLKRIADLLENVVSHNFDRASIRVTKE